MEIMEMQLAAPQPVAAAAAAAASKPFEPDRRPCTAEIAECNCPDFCERDHANE
jgi:hypothetical protein